MISYDYPSFAALDGVHASFRCVVMVGVTMSDKSFFKPGFSSTFDHGTQRKTIIIAGGAGFIGSNLCKRLIEAGERVICIDNLSTGRRENIAGLIAHPNFAFYLHDIVKPFGISGPVHQIYNLACPASPPKYQIDPIHTFKTSIIGAVNLLRVAELKRARILQSSTSEVYGDPEISPQAESYRGQVNTVGPRACYDEGKRATETLFYEMHRQRQIDVRIARIFNTYGPRMDPDDGRVVSNFIVQALQDQALTVYGDGSQTRSFCYIEDMLDGLMALMEADSALSTISDPVNLGNPGEFNMLELAQMVREMTDTRADIEFRPLPKDDPHQRRPDIGRAKGLLGWEPHVPLRLGLMATIPYFRAQIEQGQTLRRGGAVA